MSNLFSRAATGLLPRRSPQFLFRSTPDGLAVQLGRRMPVHLPGKPHREIRHKKDPQNTVDSVDIDVGDETTRPAVASVSETLDGSTSASTIAPRIPSSGESVPIGLSDGNDGSDGIPGPLCDSAGSSRRDMGALIESTQ